MVETNLGTNPYNLTIHDKNYQKRMRCPGYMELELNEEFGFNAGTGRITMPASHPLAKQIMESSHTVVPVTASRNGWKWTGQVVDWEATGVPGREVLTVELIDDLDQLNGCIAYPSPNSVLAVQKKHDYQVGRLENVVYHYLSENLSRSGTPCYIMMPPPPLSDKSPIIDVSARMTPLDELLRDVLDQHNYDITAKMWWPGEPFPSGKMLALVDDNWASRKRAIREAGLDQLFNPQGGAVRKPTVPGLVIQVSPVRERPHVRFSTNGRDITSFKLSGKAPGATKQIVGSKSDDWVNELIGIGIDTAVQGILTAIGGVAAGPIGAAIGGVVGGILKNQTQDTLFAFTSRDAIELAEQLGPFRRREAFTSSSSGIFTYDTSILAERALLDAQGGRAINIQIADGVSKVLGDDQRADNGKIRHGFRVGDRCTFDEHLSGAVVSDIISGVQVTDKVGERCRIVPRVGKRKYTTNAFLDVTNIIKRVLSAQNDIGLS